MSIQTLRLIYSSRQRSKQLTVWRSVHNFKYVSQALSAVQNLARSPVRLSTLITFLALPTTVLPSYTIKQLASWHFGSANLELETAEASTKRKIQREINSKPLVSIKSKVILLGSFYISLFCSNMAVILSELVCASLCLSWSCRPLPIMTNTLWLVTRRQGTVCSICRH